MRHLPTTAVARSFLALLALASLLLQTDRALCIGVDGHLAVEAAAGPEGDCCPADRTEPVDSPADLTKDSCGPCLDVSLPPWNLTRLVKDDASLDVVTASAAETLRPASTDRRSAVTASGSPDFRQGRSHLTAVLRC